MRRLLLPLLTSVLVSAVAPAHAQSLPASVQTYFGQDTEGAPYTAVPLNGNAATARAAFDGAIRLETVGLESFEGTRYGGRDYTVNDTRFRTLPVTFRGSGNSRTTREDVTATFEGTTDDQFQLRNDRNYGAFATAGGQFLGSDASGIDIAFDTPVSAFGFYGTDFGEGGTTEVTLTLTDTAGDTFSFTRGLVLDETGNVMFVGFTDQERQYTRVVISADNDAEYFGFDSFIIADVNQVTGLEFASGVNDPGDVREEVVEGQTVRLLLRLDDQAFPNGGSVDVALVAGGPNPGDASDLDRYATQTATVAAGDNLVAVPVRVTDDGVPDDGETFVFTLQNGTGGFAGRDGETFTLTVGDPLPVFSQSAGPAVETEPTTLTFAVDNGGNGRGATDLAFSLPLPAGLAVASPSGAASSCGGSVSAAGGDLALSGGSVGPDAACAVTVDVVPSAVGDYALPPVFLGTARGAAKADGLTLSAVRGVSLSADATDAAEGGTVRLTATLTSGARGGETVEVALAAAGTTGGAGDLSAGGASPYATQTLAFAAGETTASVDVTVNDDGLTEGEETFRFALQEAAGAAVAGPSAVDLTVAASGPRAAFVATAGADPAQTDNGATVSVDAVEGDAVTLTVSLSDGAAGGESVDVVLVAGAPTTGQAADLGTPADGPYQTVTVAFDAGERSRTVTVPVVADGVAEPAELVRLALQNPQGGLTLGGAGAFDLSVAESFAGASFASATADASEGDLVTIALELSASAQGERTVDVVLAEGADDFGGFTRQTATFADGETTAEVTVPVSADGLAEAAETFRFTLDGLTDPSGPQALDVTVAESYATAAFASATRAAREGDEVTVTVTLSGPARDGESVEVALVDGDPADLDGFTSQTLAFAPGATSATFTVAVTADGEAERDVEETFRFALRDERNLDLGDPATLDLAVGRTGSFLSFDVVQDVVGEGAGTYAVALSLSDPLVGTAFFTLALGSGDPVDLGGFTEREVAVPAGATSVRVEVPLTDDDAREPDEAFVFALSGARGNEPEGLALDRSTFSLVVADNDGPGGSGGGSGGSGGTRPPVTVTAPPLDADGDGVEDGGPRYVAVPVAGLTAADVARLAAGDGPAPTVYVLDGSGALVPAAPDLALAPGQAVYVDVAPGAELAFRGRAPEGPVAFAPVGRSSGAGRLQVAVANPAGRPVRLSDLVVEGGTLADVVLVLDPATGAFAPVSLAALADGADVIAAFGTVVVEVVPDGDPNAVHVSLDPAAADGALDAAGSGLAPGADRCEPSDGDEAVVCLALGLGADARNLNVRDRAVVRLRRPADDVRGLGAALDGYDGFDIWSPTGAQLSLPGGPDGSVRLAALSTPFEDEVTVPVGVVVPGPGTYTLSLARPVGVFAGAEREVVVLDRGAEAVLAFDEPYRFEVAPDEAPSEAFAERFAVRVGPRRAVSAVAGPSADRVGPVYPNPSAGRAALDVAVSEAQRVRVAVYDALGREVAAAFDGEVRPGAPARVSLGEAGLAPGVYVVRVSGATVGGTRRLTVVR